MEIGLLSTDSELAMALVRILYLKANHTIISNINSIIDKVMHRMILSSCPSRILLLILVMEIGELAALGKLSQI